MPAIYAQAEVFFPASGFHFRNNQVRNPGSVAKGRVVVLHRLVYFRQCALEQPDSVKG